MNEEELKACKIFIAEKTLAYAEQGYQISNVVRARNRFAGEKFIVFFGDEPGNLNYNLLANEEALKHCVLCKMNSSWRVVDCYMLPEMKPVTFGYEIIVKIPN